MEEEVVELALVDFRIDLLISKALMARAVEIVVAAANILANERNLLLYYVLQI